MTELDLDWSGLKQHLDALRTIERREMRNLGFRLIGWREPIGFVNENDRRSLRRERCKHARALIGEIRALRYAIDVIGVAP